MVKRVGGGGTKRKIDKKEKISKREYRATTFSKRCSGLHSKAAQLCLLADAQIAILATPPSSQSNVSFFSFGHSSVDAVVNAYLTGQRLAPVREEPMEEDIGVCLARKELGLELWWEKESLSKSKDRQELMEAIKAMERMLIKLRSGDFVSNYKQREEDLKNNEMTKRDVVLHKETQEPDGTLNLQAVCCIPDDDSPAGCNKITEEQKQILAICDSFCAKEDNNINGLSGSLDRSDQAMDHLMNIDGLIDLEIMKAQHSIMVFRIVLKRFMRLREVFSLTLKLLAISNSEGVEDKTLVFHSKPLLPFKVNSISYLCITRDHYE